MQLTFFTWIVRLVLVCVMTSRAKSKNAWHLEKQSVWILARRGFPGGIRMQQKWGRKVVSTDVTLCAICAEESMEAYDAVAVARAMPVNIVDGLVTGLDRAELIQLLNLDLSWPMVTDIKGVHSPSLSAPRTLKIHVKDCPFLDAGTSSECCTGSVILRSGHSTVSMPCYRTDILANSSVCAHCDQLWALQDDDSFYALDPKTMEEAAEFYRAGKTGVMKKWPELVAAEQMFEEEVQSAKDIFADSEDELTASFPDVGFQDFCKLILNDAGVLFHDAGRSQNPYRRTAEQQARVGVYVQKMVVLWVRVKAAVSTEQFDAFFNTLCAVANRVENAARWAVQRTFQSYPVFVGPLVAADIIVAGFKAAESRYDHQVGRVMQNSMEAKNVKDLSVGPVIERLDKWAKTVKKQKRASPVKRKPAVKQEPATPMWNAAAEAPAGVTANLNDAFQTPAPSTEHGHAAKAPRDSGSSVDIGAAQVGIPGKKVFYGVGRGVKPGVYASWEEAQAQVLHFSGSRVKRFKSVVSAERYVAQVQAEKRSVWYVLKNSGRDGAYESREVAEAYKCAGSTLVEKHSLTAVKRFLGKNRVRVFRVEPEEEKQPERGAGGAAKASSSQSSGDATKTTNSQSSAADSSVNDSAAAPPSSQTAAAPAATASAVQFFAIKGGSEDGVYASLKEVLAALAKGSGEFEVFATEAAAAEFCRPPDLPSKVEDMFIVWSGKSTGVMNAAGCVKATAGVKGARAEGPMSREKAEELWKKKQKKADAGGSAVASKSGASSTNKDAGASSSKTELTHVEYPSEQDWEKVAAGTQSRVFACWIAKGKGRIAFSWDEAARGVTKDVSVKVFNAEPNVFLNFARAEEYLANSTTESSIAERISSARKAVAAKGTRKEESNHSGAAAATASASPSGKSARVRVGMSGVVHTREITQIRRCFIDATSAVEMRGAPHEPEEDELDRDMPAPGAATYLSEDVKSHEGSDKSDLTLLEFFSYKKNKSKAWPLKTFDEYLSFCRQGQRLCAASSKDVGVANAVMFYELLDIAVKAHDQMRRRGTLGPEEIRFQIRMYLHTQHATNHGVLYTGASAMRAFESAVDTFGIAKVPRYRSLYRNGGGERGAGRSAGRNAAGYNKSTSPVKPVSGCYLCEAADHYANDPKFHPRLANGKHASISEDKKKAIIARIEKSALSAEEKTAEKAQVRKYWSQHSL